MLDLGCIRMTMSNLWIARVEFNGDVNSLSLVNDEAIARFKLLSAGDDFQGITLQKVYTQLEREFLLKGRHFDNLIEDHDYEMLVEVEDSVTNFQMQHLFFRQVENIIVITSLSNYTPSEEEEMRKIVDSIQPGTELNNQQALSNLNVHINLQDWDKFGSIAIRNSVVNEV